MSSIRVHAPATVANLGCGFDVFGMAIGSVGDEVTMKPNKTGEVRITKITGDGGKLSTDPSQNTAAVAVNAMLRFMGSGQGFDISLKKKMPLGSGLGSSAASAAAGLIAANHLLGKPFTRQQLVPFAMEGEMAACGSAHADNVAPALLGGIVLIRSYYPLDIIQLPVPSKLYAVLLHPHLELLTRDSREVLPKKVPMEDAVRQWANTAALVSGLYTEDYKLIGRAVEDYVAEPYRAELIPGFQAAKELALLKGALACSISGSGPSVFALAEGENSCRRIATAMKGVYKKLGIGCDVFISKVNTKGASVMS